MAAVGFEPTPPNRLVPNTSALDHSATLPDMEAHPILTSSDFIRAELLVAVNLSQGQLHHKILKEEHNMFGKT